ncbi:MAG: RNA polymerase sigma factor [Calditrichaeota bacterium]|nr:MAG: RNA polymerase sigma factor [Calditrichota bacterium]MBL1205103.1 RNA polymerase sigma factor [Calditrichota bacterium]NOG44933.1 RNA polymerase sigma factor [Calditrichota bacterium]
MTDVATIQRPEIINDLFEQDLIARCQQGEINAFRELYDLHGTMLFSIAMRVLGKKEDAEDAMQNAFTRLFKNIGQFRFQSKFSSYLVRILINSCYDIIEKRKQSFDSIDSIQQSTESFPDLKMALEKAITLLPLKMRECFILFAVQGFKQSEVAEMLEIKEGTVKAHIFQAKEKLKQTLKD